MAFTKIRETIAAFRSQPGPTFDEKRFAQHARQQAPAAAGDDRHQPTPLQVMVVQILLLIVVVMPVSLLLSGLPPKGRAVGIITSMILTYAVTRIHGAIVERIL